MPALPPRPSLEHLKNQAKALLPARLRRADPSVRDPVHGGDALGWARRFAPKSLADRLAARLGASEPPPR